MQRVKINEKKKQLKITTKQLSKILDVKYNTLAMVLAGHYTNTNIEIKLLEWYKK
jgi:predicted nucleic-acid-binding Zn-ribbon protein